MIRRISLAIPIAPLYDNGNSMWFNRVVSEMHADDDSNIKPPLWKKNPTENPELVTDFSWLDLSALDGIEDFARALYDFSDGTVGIISPAYDWGLPSIVKEFLEKASFRTDYLYFAATYGTIPGAIGYMANKAIRERTIDAYYSVRMPDTWTPIFDLSTPEKVAKYTRHTESEIDRMIQGVRERRTNRHLRPRTPAIITKLIAEPLYNKKVRRTSNLHAENTCIGCGLCAKKCPVQAIAMRDGRPVWVKDRCVMCLGCLHRCPKFAIQYGNRTKKHGQYTNPNVKV